MTQSPGLDYAQAAVPPPPDTGGISIGFQATIGTLATAMQRWCDLQDKAAAVKSQLPVAIPIVSVVTVPTPAAAVVVDLGGPQQGRQWTVRRWAVADGGDTAAAIAGTTRADLFVGKPYAVGAGSTRGAIQQWADTMNPLPNLRIPSNEAISVQPQDHLFVIITGATTSGQQLAVAVAILDEPQASYTAVQEV